MEKMITGNLSARSASSPREMDEDQRNKVEGVNVLKSIRWIRRWRWDTVKRWHVVLWIPGGRHACAYGTIPKYHYVCTAVLLFSSTTDTINNIIIFITNLILQNSIGVYYNIQTGFFFLFTISFSCFLECQ